MNVPATMPAHDLTIYSSFTTGVVALPAGTYIVGGKKMMKR